MANAPDSLTLKRNRDLVGRRGYRWLRRGLLTLLLVFILLGLANIFGQRPGTATTATGRARLALYAPPAVRGGLLWEARFTIDAVTDLKDARLVLDRGWLEGMTVNTIEPSPIGEASDAGRLSLDLGHVPAGSRYVLWMQFQVNPTNVGGYEQDVDLYDGEQHLLTRSHHIRVWP